jgi:hypothetical protein
MKDNKVIFIDRPTTLSLPPDRVLEAAIDCLDKAIVVGLDKKGELYFASSIGDDNGGMAEVNWLLDKAKQQVLRMDELEEE